MGDAAERADHFLRHERAFRLGFLPTEQPHPLTAGLSEAIARDPADGVRMLQRVDATLPAAAERVFAAPGFRALVEALEATLRRGGRVFFTGCGATGRLAILLETCWRNHWSGRDPAMAERVVSVMAGGDFALIKSVEGFEDFTDFGRHQLREAGVAAGDTVVAVTEGGETSFVIGTAWEALAAGASSFFVFNNPADVLRAHIERSRGVIDEPRITKLELYSGSMAVAGSTRMQATTLELLVLATALDEVVARLAGAAVGAGEAAARFRTLLSELGEADNVAALATLAKLEAETYAAGGLVTYFASDYVLDILTDTTERAPTFSLPPFRRRGDDASPVSWSFVKDPLAETPEAWRRLLGREPRGISWTTDDYARMGAPQALRDAPPRLDHAEILKFEIGRAADPSRVRTPLCTAVAVAVGGRPLPAADAMHAFPRRALLEIGAVSAPSFDGGRFGVACTLPPSPMDLWAHLAVKLVFNTLSTVTMGVAGRLTSNWMVYVSTSNKKLIDRGVRLISDRAGVPYDDACHALFGTLEDWPRLNAERGGAASPVAVTIERLRGCTPSNGHGPRSA